MINIGDTVIRNLCGVVMELRVTDVTTDKIVCGDWEFCNVTGAEIDDELGWGPPPKATGSYLEEFTK